MTSKPIKLGDWVCYNNAENKLQAHNTSHKRAKTGQAITLRSKIKRYFTSLFRESRPHIPDADNHDDEWTCHGRTLMRYTNPPFGNQIILTGDGEYPGNSATASAENHEHHYFKSPTLVADSPTDGTLYQSGEVRDSANPHSGSNYIAPTPTIPDRNTLRMVTPTTVPDDQGSQNSMV